jgi:hypothetical protein
VGDGLMFCDGVKSEDGAGDVRRRHVSRNFGWGLVFGWRLVLRGQGESGFFDDGWRSAGVRALGEFGGGEEFEVAAGAVA